MCLLSAIDWTKVVSVFSALLTPTIGIITVYIAYQQHLINKRQLRLALFERRLAVFNGTMKLVSTIVRKANIDVAEIYEFDAVTREAPFLFGKDITDYMTELRTKAVFVYGNHNLPAGEREFQKETEIVVWFSKQFEGGTLKFAEYMSLETAR